MSTGRGAPVMRRARVDVGSGGMTVMSRRPRACVGVVVAVCLSGVVLPSGPVSAEGSNSGSAVSPATGTPYDVVHTCASSNTAVRFRPLRTNPGVEMWIAPSDRRGPTSQGGAVFQNTSGAPDALVQSSGIDTSPIVSVTIRDKFEGDGPLTDVLTVPITCPDYASLGATAFTSIAPTRMLDTRPASRIGPVLADRPSAGSSVEVVVAGQRGIPADVVAVAVNVTATEAAGPGYVQVLPTRRALPGSSSTLNVERAGQTIANGSIVAVGEGGAISVFTQSGSHLVLDVVGYFRPAPDARAAGRLVVTTPIRILDTRPSSAVNWTGAKPGAGSIVRIDTQAAPSPVPAGRASAVVVGLTATETSAPGFLQTGAAGALVPGASSSLNADRANQTIANTVTVPLSADGAFEIFVQAGAHVVVDVLGWYTNASNPASRSGLFVPLTPERVFDSRVTTCVNCGGSIRGERDFRTGALVPRAVARVQVGRIERQASAVQANVTVTEVAGDGFFQAGALGTLVPGASSTLNAVAGQTIANSAIVPLGREVPSVLAQFGAGALQAGFGVFTQSGGQLIVDVTGYFSK